MSLERRQIQGFSMIELLVALVVSLVTLMGAAGLVVRTVQEEAESYQRVQALTLVQDMADRINVNRQVAACYSDGGNDIAVGEGVAAADIPDCGTSDAENRADADLLAWHNALLGTSEQSSGGANLGTLIGARGCIEQIAGVDRTYRITVAWQGLAEQELSANVAANRNDCGFGDYERESLRRIYSVIIRMADLS